MRTVMNFNVTDTKVKVTVTIPFGMENVCFQHINGKVFFAFMIGGHLYRPQMKDIVRFQKMYGVRSYRCVAEFMQGETLTMIRTTL